ncbi:MAG: putative lipid II flippase FtsW, partial [Myxococcales bacterium]|nr:putative lipid II flippase FtsW [Myxococcales bacterium]
MSAPAKRWTWTETLIATAALLMAAGVAMVYSASSVVALSKFGDAEYYLWRQIVFAGIAMGTLFAVGRVPVERFRRLAYPAMIVVGLLLLAVLIDGVGIRVGGAKRWLPLGPIRFQPSELAKVAAVLYLAHSLAKKEDAVRSFKIGIVSHLAILGFLAALILIEPDLGTVVILAAVTTVMLFTGGVRPSHLLALALGAAPVAIYYIQGHAYQIRRLLSWLRPWEEADGAGWQLTQSYLAFASGGLGGAGIGGSKQKLFFLPEGHTDFIFAILAEEWGALGAVAVLAAFAIIFVGGVRVALRSPDRFTALLALGVGSLLAVQALVNISITVGLLPTKGLVLPFVSYG